MTLENAKVKLGKYGQEHVLKYYDELSDAEKEALLTQIEETDMTIAECGNFKNKADFVEVVRCEKCKHGDVSIIGKSKDGEETVACYCNLEGKVCSLEWYCPNGERKDAE